MDQTSTIVGNDLFAYAAERRKLPNVGDSVHVPSLNKQALVLKVNPSREELLVQAGNMKLKLKLTDVLTWKVPVPGRFFISSSCSEKCAWESGIGIWNRFSLPAIGMMEQLNLLNMEYKWSIGIFPDYHILIINSIDLGHII